MAALCWRRDPDYRAKISRGRKAAIARSMAGEGFIYSALLANGVVKIGYSLTPEKRIKSFRGAALIGKMRATIAEERALHRTLRQFYRSDLPGFEHYSESILTHGAVPPALKAAP